MRMIWSAIFVGLILLLYAPVLKHLVLQWWTDADDDHGFFVPLLLVNSSAAKEPRMRSPMAPTIVTKPKLAGLISVLVQG